MLTWSIRFSQCSQTTYPIVYCLEISKISFQCIPILIWFNTGLYWDIITVQSILRGLFNWLCKVCISLGWPFYFYSKYLSLEPVACTDHSTDVIEDSLPILLLTFVFNLWLFKRNSLVNIQFPVVHFTFLNHAARPPHSQIHSQLFSAVFNELQHLWGSSSRGSASGTSKPGNFKGCKLMRAAKSQF